MNLDVKFIGLNDTFELVWHWNFDIRMIGAKSSHFDWAWFESELTLDFGAIQLNYGQRGVLQSYPGKLLQVPRVYKSAQEFPWKNFIMEKNCHFDGW